MTNKVTTEEEQGIVHHLIGFLDPCVVDFNAKKFADLALPIVRMDVTTLT